MKIKYVLLLIIAPFFLMIMINETSPASTAVYQKEACTRYCHNKTCHHVEANTLTNSLTHLYEKNILWLQHNPFGMSYRLINLLVYVVLYPILIGLLLWGLIRKRHV